MCRLCRLVVSAAAALLLLAPAAVAVPAGAGAPAAPTGSLLLAVQGTETPTGEPTETEPPGPEPSGPDVSGNPAAPQDYEANFLWGAAVGLLVLSILGVAGLGALYFALVVRPRRRSEEE